MLWLASFKLEENNAITRKFDDNGSKGVARVVVQGGRAAVKDLAEELVRKSEEELNKKQNEDRNSAEIQGLEKDRRETVGECLKKAYKETKGWLTTYANRRGTAGYRSVEAIIGKQLELINCLFLFFGEI